MRGVLRERRLSVADALLPKRHGVESTAARIEDLRTLACEVCFGIGFPLG